MEVHGFLCVEPELGRGSESRSELQVRFTTLTSYPRLALFEKGRAPALVTGPEGLYAGAMLDWSRCPATERVPGKVSGAWVFKGTRVPVKALFDNLEDDARVDDFLEWFPGVSREQVEFVLQFAGQSLIEA